MADSEYVIPSMRGKVKPVAAPQQSKAPAPRQAAAPSYVIPSQRGKPATPPKPSSWYDAGMSALSALPRLVEGVAGTPGDIAHAYNTGIRYLWNNARGRPQTWTQASQQQAEDDRKSYFRVGPTSDEISSRIVDPTIKKLSRGKYTGLYQPQTGAGRITSGVVQGIGSTVLPGGGGSVGARAVTGALAGLGGSGGSELVHRVLPEDSPYTEPLAETASVLGTIIGGGVPSAASAVKTARSLSAARAERNAARILQQSLVDPSETAEALRAYNASGAARNPNFKPTFSQVAGTGDAAALEAKVAGATGSTKIPLQKRKTLAASGTPASAPGEILGPAMGTGKVEDAPNIFARSPKTEEEMAAEIKAAEEAAAARTAEFEGKKSTGMAQVTGATPNMKSDASAALHQHLAEVEKGMKKREQEAWHAANQSGVTLDGPEVVHSARQFVENVPSATRKLLGDSISGLEDVATDWGDANIPIEQWQALRSRALSNARSARNSGNFAAAKVNGEFADLLGQHIDGAFTETGEHLPSPFLHLPDEAASNAWRDAVARTKERKDLFSKTAAGDAIATKPDGTFINAPEAAIPSILSGPKGLQNARALRSSPSFIDQKLVDQALTDHYVGELTNNGTNPNVRSADVDAMLKDSKTATILGEVPGVGQKMGEVKNAAVQHEADIGKAKSENDTLMEALKRAHDRERDLAKVQQGFNESFAAGPKQLKSFLDNNKADVLDAVHPDNHQFVQQLHENAAALASGDTTPGIPSRTLGAVASGNPSLQFSEAYSPGANNMIDRAGGVASLGEAMAVPAILGVPENLRGLVEVGSLKPASGITGKVSNFVKNIAMKDTNERTLSNLERAMTNPAEAERYITTPAESFMPKDPYAQIRTRMGAPVATSLSVKQNYHIPDPLAGLDVGHGEDEHEGVPLDLEEHGADNTDEGVPLERFAGGRVGFRSGGAVNEKNVEELVQALMKKAKHAKTHSDNATKPLLNQDDSAIVRALDVAQKAI